MIKLEKKVKPK